MSKLPSGQVGYTGGCSAPGPATWHYEQEAEAGEGGEMNSVQTVAAVGLAGWAIYLFRKRLRDFPVARMRAWMRAWRPFRHLDQVIIRLVLIGLLVLVGLVIDAFAGEAAAPAFSNPIGSLYLRDIFHGLVWLGLQYWLVLKPIMFLATAPWWKHEPRADPARVGS